MIPKDISKQIALYSIAGYEHLLERINTLEAQRRIVYEVEMNSLNQDEGQCDWCLLRFETYDLTEHQCASNEFNICSTFCMRDVCLRNGAPIELCSLCDYPVCTDCVRVCPTCNVSFCRTCTHEH